MHRRAPAVVTAMIASAVFLAGPVVRIARTADDGDAPRRAA